MPETDVFNATIANIESGKRYKTSSKDRFISILLT